MQRDPTITALAACGLSCLKAANGHHRRWAGVIPGVRMPNERLAPWSPMRVMYASTVG